MRGAPGIALVLVLLLLVALVAAQVQELASTEFDHASKSSSYYPAVGGMQEGGVQDKSRTGCSQVIAPGTEWT